MGVRPGGRTTSGLPSVGHMMTLAQIYADAWSQLDPDLADDIVAALPTQRASAGDIEARTGLPRGSTA